MPEAENMRVVQEFYAAVSRDDVQAILGLLAPEVDWTFLGTKEIPFAGKWKGVDQVSKFFAVIGDTMQLEQFGPEEFVAQGDWVVALGRERMRIKTTGRSYDAAWTHVFRLRDSKITIYREYSDTAAILAAFRPA
jgi:hypothetical protein